MTQYLLGQGKIYAGLRTAAGLPKALRWLGDVSEATLSLKVDTIKHKESYSGQRATAKKVNIGKEASLDMTLMELGQENAALLLFGTASAIASGSVTAEAMPTVVAGDRVPLKYPKVTSVVITDSNGTPATLNSSKYEVDPVYGTITFLDVAAMTQPFKVAYTHAAIDSLSVFSSIPSDLFIRYEGINLAGDGAPIIMEFYKVSTEPLKELALIGTKLSEQKLSAEVLIDSVRPADAELGQFGRILRLSAA